MKNKQKDRAYMKAIRFYEDGELDKALKMCDESISSNLRNSATLNLKGLILYIKGNLEGAKAQWKINSEHNDDSIAKHYIHDSRSDIRRLEMYRLGENYLKQLKVEDAIGALTECVESDFNSIKVNTALAICYFRKGDYTTSSVYVTKVLKTDKNNQGAKNLAKELKNIAGIELEVHKNNNWVKIIIYILATTITLIAIGIGTKVILSYMSSNNEISDKNVAENNTTEDSESEDKLELNKSQESPNETNDTEEKGKTKTENLVDFSALESAIKNKNYEIIYSDVKNINEANLTGKEKTIYFNAKEALRNEGVSFFYKKGSELYSQKAFSEAKSEFQKGYEFGEGNYIYPHIIFFKASTEENLGNINEAITGYEEFYNKFKNETYIEETIYKLALLYKDRDIDKSIMYAKEIKEKYPSSMYNNNVISNLLDNK